MMMMMVIDDDLVGLKAYACLLYGGKKVASLAENNR